MKLSKCDAAALGSRAEISKIVLNFVRNAELMKE